MDSAHNEEENSRRYYAISEVGARTGLEPHVLRFWQSKFETLQPQKNEAGRRAYTEQDIATVQRIKHLLRSEKYTIEGARQVIASDDDDERQARREELAEMRRFLTDLLERV